MVSSVVPGIRQEKQMAQLDRITQDPEVMGGKPCIRGMRVTVGMIVGQIGAGHSIEEVLAEYPYLEREDMLQALRYAAYRRTGRTPVQRDHLGNGPARTGPERTSAHTCRQ